MSEVNHPDALPPPAAATDEGDGQLRTTVRNDWMRQVHQIRKQEFAYLRSLQKRQGSGDAESTLAGFQTVALSLGSVREDTLKKIDQIESRLNLLWVASHAKASSSGFPSGTAPISVLPSPSVAGTTTQPVSALSAATAPGLFTKTMYDVEMPGSVLMVDTVDTLATQIRPSALRPTVPHPAPVPAPKMQAQTDSVLLTAAALFARGETDLAAQHLLRAVRANDADKTHTLRRLLGLLEIYRATGNQAQFDWSVLEYFDHWDGSTPHWRNTIAAAAAEPIQKRKADETGAFTASEMNLANIWRCPSTLDRGAGRQLCDFWLANRHCAIDWTSLSVIDPDAASDLASFFTSTNQGPTQLVFFDTPNLLYVLEHATPQGQAQVPRSLWSLRLCLLGQMHMQAAFNAAVADYCLTYIESAPDWRPGQARFDGDATSNPTPKEWGDADVQTTPWRLHGHVLGARALTLPDWPLPGVQQAITITCKGLVRMDDAAVRQLLEWARQAKAQNLAVHFTDVSLLVGALWTAAGLEVYASVSVRELQ